MFEFVCIRHLLVPFHVFNWEESTNINCAARMPELLNAFVREKHLLNFLLGELGLSVLEVEGSAAELAQGQLMFPGHHFSCVGLHGEDLVNKCAYMIVGERLELI